MVALRPAASLVAAPDQPTLEPDARALQQLPQRLPEVVPAQRVQEEVYGEIDVVDVNEEFLQRQHERRRSVVGSDEGHDEEVDADRVRRQVEQQEHGRDDEQHLGDALLPRRRLQRQLLRRRCWGAATCRNAKLACFSKHRFSFPCGAPLA